MKYDGTQKAVKSAMSRFGVPVSQLTQEDLHLDLTSFAMEERIKKMRDEEFSRLYQERQKKLNSQKSREELTMANNRKFKMSDEEKENVHKYGNAFVKGHSRKGQELLTPAQRRKVGRKFATVEEAIEDNRFEAYRNVKHGSGKAQKNEQEIRRNYRRNGERVNLELMDSKCYDPKCDMRKPLREGVEADWRKIVAGKCADLMRNYAGWMRTHRNDYDAHINGNLAKEVERIASTIKRDQVMTALSDYEFRRLRALYNDFFPGNEVWRLIAVY